jgi:ribosomal protein S12 methylthiotransferase accessory factor
MIAGSRDDNFPTQYAAQYDAAKVASTRHVFFSDSGCNDFRARQSISTPTIQGDLDALLALLPEAGLDTVILVDLTQSGIDIPTVKVVIPGLEYFALFIGYSPGRRSRDQAARRMAATQ